MLAAVGWSVRTAPAEGLPRISLRDNETVVACIDSRGLSSVSTLVDALLEAHPDLPLIAMSDSRSEKKDGVGALLSVCRSRLRFPLDTHALSRALEECTASPVPRNGPRDHQGRAIDALLGQSQAWLEVLARLHQFAPIDLPLMISGETGTGKELVARAVHERSPRRNAPFVAVNCGALPSGLIQSELFGHERGAFTGANSRRIGHFEAADGGTIFLDEIGDLPLDAQVNLLRVLQEGSLQRVGGSQPIHVDVRVIAATHVDLHHAVETGRFREDLLFRLDVLRLPIPPLRSRGEDIGHLARTFLDDFRQAHTGTIARSFNAAARQAMSEHAWPGNVRELLNRVRRAAVEAKSSQITPEDLGLSGDEMPTGDLQSARTHAERDALLAMLLETGYNVSACARRLGVSRVTVYRLCRKHGISIRPALA